MDQLTVQAPLIVLRTAYKFSGLISPDLSFYISIHFYTDEITISGGLMGINGLPGMIPGFIIPRMFTSYIATNYR